MADMDKALATQLANIDELVGWIRQAYGSAG